MVVCLDAELVAISSTFADSPGEEVPSITSSESGRYFFKMIPEKRLITAKGVEKKRKAYGVAYEIRKDGSYKELWRTSDWYSFRVYLSDYENRDHLVRMGPSAEDQENHTDLARISHTFCRKRILDRNFGRGLGDERS